MIQSAFNTLISSNSLLLEEAKTKVRDSVDPKFKEIILSKLPSPENIKNQLTTNINTLDDLKSTADRYNTLRARCDNLLGQTESKISQLEAIKKKVTQINDNFSRLDEVIDIANQFLPTIKIIISTAPAALSVLSGPLANGLAIKKIGDGLDIAKGVVANVETIVKVISSVKGQITKQTSTISSQIDPSIEVLNRLKGNIQSNIDYTDNVFTQVISKFSESVDKDTLTENTVLSTGDPKKLFNKILSQQRTNN
jgi:DNA repair exonuclease SbcCD ATPase subunit